MSLEYFDGRVVVVSKRKETDKGVLTPCNKLCGVVRIPAYAKYSCWMRVLLGYLQLFALLWVCDGENNCTIVLRAH
jgi:hypothetical protein